MAEFNWEKEEKAFVYAVNSCGVYFDNKHPDSARNETLGEITQNDFLAGYNQALKDSKAPEMLEMLININEYLLSMSCVKSHSYQVEVEQLIKEATEI